MFRYTLDYVDPTWVPWVPGPKTPAELLQDTFRTYLHFLPCPRPPKTRSLQDINACLEHLNVSADSLQHAQELYTTHVPGYVLLFHDDMDIAMVYAALLLTDFEKAKGLTNLSKEKGLAFFQKETAYECLLMAVTKKQDLPRLPDGIPYHYWVANMNILDKDREDVLDHVKTIHKTTRLAYSYLLDKCLVQLGMQLQIGFKAEE